ncbi:MAG: hypothetical protein JXA73_13975 [Acidobacteria bacterium]|nr:hypothetical protein [Acidobacteriota bacterium]
MRKRSSVAELERKAASIAPPRPLLPAVPEKEAIAMLSRRLLHPEITPREVPFPQAIDDDPADKLCEWLGHYAFRLFLRGAIQRSEGFLPAETTRYVDKVQAMHYAEVLVSLGLAEKTSGLRYRLKWPVRNFGGTLEWYVGKELERRYGFSVATGVKLHVRGGGGDLDVVAAAEGKLVYIELKSSPPKNLAANEMGAFCDRLILLRPDVSLFVVDTALRLSDKVVPMLTAELRRRLFSMNKPVKIAAQLWALTPHIYAVNGSRDLMDNIMKAISAGLRVLSPSLNR